MAVCSKCGREYDDENGSCPECGTPADAQPQADSSPAPPRTGGSKWGLAVAAVGAVIAVVLTAYLLKPAPTEEITAESTAAETVTQTAATQTRLTTAQTTVSEAVTATEKASTTAAETSETVLTAAAESTATETDSPIRSVTFEPSEHELVTGENISCTIMLSDFPDCKTAFTDKTVFTAEYTATSNLQGKAPVVMTLTIDGTDAEVMSDTFDDTTVSFAYADMSEAVMELGFSPDDIDLISFRSDGTPVDVHKIIIT